MIKGRLCVSCYNREREAIIGRNAKGTVPRLSGKLHTVAIAVLEDSGGRIQVFERVTSVVEAMIIAAKGANGPIAFGRPVAALVTP